MGRDFDVEIDSRALRHRTQLTLPDDLPLDDWCRIGTKLLAVSDSSAWWIGDWLAFGHDMYPDRYKRAMAETSLDYQTLRNYVWVARAFPPSRRRDVLTFQHHMEVAALPQSEQDHWLDFATRFKWSRNELRRQVRASSDNDRKGERLSQIVLHLGLTKERFERWSEAAELNNVTLQDWVVRILDQAVRKTDTR
jgi:hypothetical protein